MATMTIPGMEIPDYVGYGIAAAIIIVFLLLYYFVSYWSNIRNNQPETHAMAQARKENKPLMIVVDKADRMMFAVADKEKKYTVSFIKEDYGLKVDPGILSNAPKCHMVDGLPVYIFGTDTYFAADLQSVQSVTSLIHQIRNEFAILEFVKDDFVLMELITRGGEDLLQDCDVVISRFLPDDELLEEQGVDVATKITKFDLAETIEIIKSSLKSRRVETGFFTVSEGLERLPFGVTSGDFERAKSLTRQEAENDNRDEWAKWKAVIIAACAAAAVIVVATIALKTVG